MGNTPVMVSVLCTTYNQESYIRKCLESLVGQETDFAYEILVHDDASTDRTADIIREFENAYPDKIRPIYQTVNQYSQGINIIDTILTPQAKGRYIAICEGDDYWTDPYKLQKQFDALEAHPEVDMCAHGAVLVKEDTEEVLREIRPSDCDRVLTTEEVILGDGGYLATNSLFYRVDLAKNSVTFCKLFPLDYSLQIMGSLRGGIWYLAESMSAYRYMAKGSWTASTKDSLAKRIAAQEFVQKMLLQADIDTEGVYHAALEQMALYYEMNVLLARGDFRKAISKQYTPYFRQLPLVAQCKIYIGALFPFLVAWKRKLRR